MTEWKSGKVKDLVMMDNSHLINCILYKYCICYKYVKVREVTFYLPVLHLYATHKQ